MIGKTLGGYRIVEQIGMGGMATVYKAYDASTDRYVAIKTLPQQYSQDPMFRTRFEREAKAIARLEHIHILPIFAYGEEGGISYMAMRYLDAGTLTDRIKQGSMPFDEIGRLLKQMASALDYAHRHDVLHRDIKPSNVMLDSTGNCFLTDFGIAKMIESASGPGAMIDLTGTGIIGTPSYMSPEQCRGEKDLTPASDQYALGVVLYQMVTRRTPYQAETPMAVIHMQLTDAPLALPRSLRADLPEAAEGVILKSLARDPNARYPSCAALAEAFEKAIAGAPIKEVVQEQIPTKALKSTRPAIVEDRPTQRGIQAAITEPLADKETALISKKGARSVWFYGLALIAIIAVVAVIAIMASGGLSGADAAATETASAIQQSTQTAFAAATQAEETAIAGDRSTGTAIALALDPTLRTIREIPARSGPGQDYDLLTQALTAGTELDILGISEDGSWYQIQLPDGNLGWVTSSAAMRLPMWMGGYSRRVSLMTSSSRRGRESASDSFNSRTRLA